VNGISWKRVACIAILTAAALVAHRLGAVQLSWAFGGAATLAYPLGRIGHRPLASDATAVEALRRGVAKVVGRALRVELGVLDGPDALGDESPLMSEQTAKIILEEVEGRRPSKPPK
jgi:hypothetical protein